MIARAFTQRVPVDNDPNIFSCTIITGLRYPLR